MAIQTPAATGGAAPKRMTSISRKFIQAGLVGFIGAMLGIVLLRQIAGTGSKTPQEIQDEKLEHDRKAASAADPNALRRNLVQQLEDQIKLNLNKQQETLSQTSPQSGPLPGAMPSLANAPTHPTGRDAKRLENLHSNLKNESDNDLYVWEPQEMLPGASDARPTATAVAAGSSTSVEARAGAVVDTNVLGAAVMPTLPADIARNASAPLSSLSAGVNTNVSFSQANSAPLTPTPASSPYWIREGWIIPAVIVQSLTTDAPGTFRAMVTTNVYDSITGHYLLIERGTMLLGAVNTEVQKGQSRMQLAVARMDFPNGAYLRLGSWNISDATGAGGITADDIDDHFWEQFGAAFAVAGITAIAGHWDRQQNVTINIGGSGTGGAASSLSGAASQALTDTVKQILQQNQSYKRTLTLEPADKINVVVAHDLLLPPEVVGSQEQ